MAHSVRDKHRAGSAENVTYAKIKTRSMEPMPDHKNKQKRLGIVKRRTTLTNTSLYSSARELLILSTIFK